VKIAFFGLPLAALLLAGDGHEIAYAGIVPGVGERRLRRLMAASRCGGCLRRMPDLSKKRVQRDLRAALPELVVSWFWVKRIPPEILGLAPSVGVHPSLLPRHRGPDPYFWAIDAGDDVTGVTAHVLAPDYDTGAILGRRTLRIDSRYNAWKLAKALDRPSLALLRDVVRAYAEGRAPIAVPQDETAATTAPQPTDEDLAIRWSWPAGRIERRVRAAAPRPGAWTEIGETVVVLERVRVTDDFPRVLVPGEAAIRRDGTAVVCAGDGALELLEGRAEDDDTRLGRDDFVRVVEAARGTDSVRPPEAKT
jgi:methionyl-tRNA formyltransferase